MKQEDCVLSLIRSGGEIKTKVSHRPHDFEPPGSKEVPNWNELYQIISVPVEEVKQSLVIKQFYAAWHRLENVNQWNAATLVDVLVLLTESVATLDSPDIPIRLMETEQASPKPTAAHPRAFRGTKYKPPKSKRPASYNLQTALGTLKNQVIVLQKLWAYRDKAIKPLSYLGYESARVESLLALSTPPIDPSLFLRHPDTPIEVKPQQFPNTFREDILPVLRGFHWNYVEMALKLFWHLELHEQSEQRAAVSRLLALSSNPSVIDWLQQIANQSREHQFILLVCAIELNVARSSCPIGIEQVLSALHEFASLERYPQWAYAMLGGLRDGICVNYLREGIRLAGEFSPDHCFYLGQSCDDFKSSVVANVLFQLPKELEDWSIKDKAMSIWKAAAQLDEFFKIFTATDWFTLSPKQVDNYLTLLLAFLRYDDDEAVKWQAKWRIFKKYHVQTEACLRLIPDAYVKQWVDDFMDFIWVHFLFYHVLLR